MCKTPGSECQPMDEDSMPLDEDNVSEGESEPMDSDSYYTVTSSDDGGSDSDAESTSGNRVTKDMVVLLMLKETGVISEEQYASKVENTTDDIKALIPKPPKSDADSSDSEDDRNSLDDLLELFLAEVKNKQSEETNNKGDIESHENEEAVAKESLKDNKSVEKEADGKKNTVSEDDANISQEEARKEQSKGDMSAMLQQEKAVTDFNQKQCDDKVIETTQEQQVLTATKQDIINQGEKQHLTCENNLLNEPDSDLKGESTDGSNNEDQGQSTKDTVPSTKEPEIVDSKSEKQYNLDPNKVTKSFKDILKQLVQEERISTEYEYVDVLESYVNDLDKYYTNNEALNRFDLPTEELKEFAFFLNFYSPSSYKYIIETFNTPLPEHKVLCSWYLKDSHRPGLSKRAFDILKQKASKKRLTCSLMARDIFLTNYGFNYDQVDYGGGCNYEYTDKAVMVYVFVLVCLDEDWKMPIGYIFAKRIPAETQAELIRVGLTQCHDVGVDVVAVTVDTPTPAEFLGCSFKDPRNLKTTFKHPVCDRDVAVWIDPCLALRSARHTLKVKGVLKDDAGAKIRWNLLRKLRNLHSDEITDFDKSEFLKLRTHIAKVGLTTEIFSNSLVPALELGEELLPNLFTDTAPTRRYIEIVNTLYDILNSRITTNMDDVAQHMTMAKEYMLGLLYNGNKLSPFDIDNLGPDKKLLYRSFVEGEPACGFIGFLICIESFKHLYATLVEKEKRMNFLNPHRLCKDHVEDFVKDLRAHSRLDPEDYTGFSFQCYYDRVFGVLEESPRLSDKNFPLGQWRLKNKYPPAVTIKLTAGKRAFDEVYSFQYRPKKLPKNSHEDRATNLVRSYSKAMDTEMDLATMKNMVGYLAGWIAARLARCLKCEACIDALCADKKLRFHKFITLKHLKGVCLPSEEIFHICWECERALRLKTSPAKLRNWVLRKLASQFPWTRSAAKHDATHHILLARAVIAKYIPLRVSAPFSLKESKRISEIYKHFTFMKKSGLFDELERICRAEEDSD